MTASAAVLRGPERTCVGCREVRPKRELIRIVLPAEGRAALDPTGKRNGRGAYLCRRTGTTCLAQARRRRALVHALRTTSDRIDWDSLAAELDTVPLEVLTSQR
jgi:predicted RNA-binding protein YlxR (DUF448 family)